MKFEGQVAALLKRSTFSHISLKRVTDLKGYGKVIVINGYTLGKKDFGSDRIRTHISCLTSDRL